MDPNMNSREEKTSRRRPQQLNDGPHSGFRSLLTTDRFLVAGICAVLTMVFVFSEHFQENNGLGHDGLFYAQLARDFPHKVFVEKIDSYYVQRLAIPAFLYYSSKTFGFELTDKTILRIWRGLDLVCLTWLAHLWCLMVRELQISQRGKWLGALFLFVNFGVLKWSSFYPNLNDIPAYTLGAWMLYLYLKGRSLSLAGLTVVAAFTWPTALYVGVLLLFFAREKNEASSAPVVPFRLHQAAALFAGLGVYLFLQHLRRQGGAHIGFETRADGAFVNLSIILSTIYVVVGLLYLLQERRLFGIGSYFRRLKTVSAWLALAVGAGVIIGQRLLAPKSYSPTTMLTVMVWSSVIDPGSFLVDHVAFYGPVVLFTVLLWKRVCSRVHECGLGITLCLCALVPLALCSESRRLFNMIPLLVPFVVKAIEECHWQAKHYLVLLGVSLLGSKVWLSINPDWVENLLRLNMAPWMSHQSYGVHAAIIVAVAYYFVHVPQTDRSVERFDATASVGTRSDPSSKAISPENRLAA